MGISATSVEFPYVIGGVSFAAKCTRQCKKYVP